MQIQNHLILKEQKENYGLKLKIKLSRVVEQVLA